MFANKGEFLLAKTVNMFRAFDTPAVAEQLDGTHAEHVAATMTALQATLLASAIADLKPGEWPDGAFGAEKLSEAIASARLLGSTDKSRLQHVLSCVKADRDAAAKLQRYCIMFEDVINSN